MLMTSAGLTFWVIPKSTCHTSPRSGTFRVLFLVQSPEHIRGQHGDVFVRQVVGHWNPLGNGSTQLDALRWRKLLNLREDIGDGLGHDGSLFSSSSSYMAKTAADALIVAWYSSSHAATSRICSMGNCSIADSISATVLMVRVYRFCPHMQLLDLDLKPVIAQPA